MQTSYSDARKSILFPAARAGGMVSSKKPCRLPAERTPHIVGTNVAVGTHSQEKHKEKYT